MTKTKKEPKADNCIEFCGRGSHEQRTHSHRAEYARADDLDSCDIAATIESRPGTDKQ
jgi:hypothetical protein